MRFSIRDLLLVTVIVALAVGWWVDRRRLLHQQDRLTRKFEENLAELSAERDHRQAELAEERLKDEVDGGYTPARSGYTPVRSPISSAPAHNP